MPVNLTNPAYTRQADKWKLTRDIIDNNARDYLCDVDPNDPIRCKKYKDDAVLMNFTALTKNGLLGLIFLNEPKVTLPPELEYLNADATGSGLNLNQLAQLICGDLMETGRFGLLIDHSREDSSENIETPDTCRLIPYSAESIINWRVERVHGQDQLTKVVLREYVTVQPNKDDEFLLETHEQYRVLRLVDGVYTQQLYNRDLKPISKQIIPTKTNGQNFNCIPFGIFGSENNDMALDNAVLYDIALLNLAVYKNSADYEESIFVSGQPTVVINVGDMPADQWKAINDGKFKFGVRGGNVVGLGGSAQLLQAAPNQLAGAAIQAKQLYAIGLGARIISPPGGRETADAARIRYASQNSALYILTKNVNKAMLQCLKWVCEFLGDIDATVLNFELNDQFYEDGADPNLIAQAIMLFDRNVVSAEEIRQYIESSGSGLILEADVPDPDDLSNVVANSQTTAISDLGDAENTNTNGVETGDVNEQ